MLAGASAGAPAGPAFRIVAARGGPTGGGPGPRPLGSAARRGGRRGAEGLVVVVVRRGGPDPPVCAAAGPAAASRKPIVPPATARRRFELSVSRINIDSSPLQACGV